jgi:hypothetical protein
MANHQIPLTAKRVEQVFGIDADGNVVVCSVYRHTRQGHELPMFYIVQYREQARHIDRSTRVTRELTGPSAPAKLAEAMTEVRAALAQSRMRAARRACL